MQATSAKQLVIRIQKLELPLDSKEKNQTPAGKSSGEAEQKSLPFQIRLSCQQSKGNFDCSFIQNS